MEHPVDRGLRGEAIIQAELLKRGHKILIPYGFNHRFDLVIYGEHNEVPFYTRAQCKTGRIKNGCVVFNTVSNGKSGRRSYDGDVDLFLVWCEGTDSIYWVPIKDVGNKVEMRLRLEPTKNGQLAGVFWASDYSLNIASPTRDGWFWVPEEYRA